MRRLLAVVLAAIALLATPANAARPACHKWQVCTTPSATPTAPPSSPWTLQFHDDFDTDVPLGSFPTGQWSAYPAGWSDTWGNGVHAPDRVVSIHDGMMDLYLHSENGQWLVAAPRPAPPRDRLSYGRIEVRFRADPVSGYATAWLLWPTSEAWPRDGEIDFPEGALTSTIKGYVHHQGATSGGDQDIYYSGATYADWHTAITEWTPGDVKLYLDGRLIGHSTSRIPNTEMRYVLQTETAYGATPSGSGHVYIDHVTLWSYTP